MIKVPHVDTFFYWFDLAFHTNGTAGLRSFICKFVESNFFCVCKPLTQLDWYLKKFTAFSYQTEKYSKRDIFFTNWCFVYFSYKFHNRFKVVCFHRLNSNISNCWWNTFILNLHKIFFWCGEWKKKVKTSIFGGIFFFELIGRFWQKCSNSFHSWYLIIIVQLRR